jgi:long-chain acyl-CoA synthetase
MLYECWRQIAREHRNETALHDLVRGERWTFAQLAAEGEKSGPAGPVAFPNGDGFIITLLKAWRAGIPACPLDADQAPPRLGQVPAGCVHLKTTSASSGEARMIAFTGEQLAADAENIVATMGLRREWPNLGVISLAHSYGFSNLVLPLLLHGIPLILADSPLPETVRQAARAAEFITLPAVPALWRAWHEAGAIPENVKVAISAGAPLPLPLEQAVFGARKLKIHNFYGASECGGIAYDAAPMPRADAACVGAPMQNVHLSVNGDGCLEVRSRAAGKTYWPAPTEKLTGGCFQTSDLAEVVDGLVYLRGRAGDQINVAGRKVSPETIENVLLAHPDVRECLVFGAPSADVERGETVVACVAAEKPVSADSLRQYLSQQLPAWQIPREWMFTNSLETNQRGKLSRAEWRRKFEERR